MRTLRLATAAFVAVVLVPLTASSALAAPPGNDTPSGARRIALGDHVVEDTSQATTDSQDAADNQNCGAPNTKASVWFKYTPSTKTAFVLDMRKSDYSGGMLIFRGAPSPSTLVACGPDTVALNGAAGVTYTIMVISDTAKNGGRLVLDLRKAPPPPKVHIRIAHHAVAYHNGDARVHGRYRCAHGQGLAFVQGSVHQRAGRLKIPSTFSKVVRCNGHPHTWAARVTSKNGTYARGRAHVHVHIIACGLFKCRQDGAKGRVHMTWAHRHHHRHHHRAAHRSRRVTTQRPEPLVARDNRWRERPSAW